MKPFKALAVITGLVLAVGSGCLLIPVRTSGTLTNLDLADPDSRFIDVLGTQIHYKVYSHRERPGPGSAAPSMLPADTPSGAMARAEPPLIILLHGFGASSFSWRLVAEPLSGYADVVAFDRPAFGLSGRPAKWQGPNPYAPDSQVAIVGAMLSAMGAERAVLVGNSAGGTVAMNFALAYPDRTAGLVLVSPAVYAGGGAPGWIRPLFYLPGVNHVGPLLARRLATGGDEFIASAWYDPARMTADVLPGYRAPLAIAGWERALWELTKASRASGLAKRLDELGMPILVITGDTDRIVPTEQSIRLAGELPDAELVVVPESGHVAHEETPEAFMLAFDRFWQRLDQP
jgi:pimeloyl-ACP methyl ester carboxylesterase